MSFRYSRYISKVTRQPWALLPEKLSAITALMQERASGVRLSDEAIAARLGDDRDERPEPRADGAVFVLPIVGTIAYRADGFMESSGGTSVQSIGRYLKKAVADAGVKSVLLDIDSPGGSVDGIAELAAQIAAATKVKPVVAHVNTLCASAAYWLACSASEIISAPSGMAGSIGVYLLMVDESEHLAKEGIVVNAISAGENKLEGAPWEPLSDEARAHFQAQVDEVYGQFLSAVAKGRGVSAADVKKNFGQGRVYRGKELVARGMVDRIATFDDTLAKMVGRKSTMSGARAETVDVDKILSDSEAAAVAIVEGACPACNGAGLKPERYMGDPQGQERCPECGGTGKPAAAEAPEPQPKPVQPPTDDAETLTAALQD